MKMAYLFHLLVWILPIIALQWVIGWKIFRRNLRPIILAPLAAGLYWGIADVFAVRSGLWHFDEEQIIGLKLGPVPIEEILFFALTALLVAQSVVLLLPARLRR